MNPIISIIIPHYNHTKALRKCLNSILKQTFQDFEIIIVDDGSNKQEKSLLEELARFYKFKLDNKLEIIYKEHKGASAARNTGAEKASGKYFLFCDADIIMRSDCLEEMLKALELNPSVAYTYSSFKYGFKTFELHSFNAEELRKINYIHTTALMRREWFPKFDEALHRLQDWDLWLTILEHGGKGIWIPKILFTVQPRRNGMSSWLPSFMYEIPWHKFGIKFKRVEAYRRAENIIKTKHHLH